VKSRTTATILEMCEENQVPVTDAYNPIYLGAEIGRIETRSQPRQIVHETSISKITTAKWTGGVTQAVKHLFCKCEALSSNLSPTKKKKKTQRNVWGEPMPEAPMWMKPTVEGRGKSRISLTSLPQCT
jgi:hypothetical protein